MNARYFRVAIIAYKLASTSSTSTSDSVNAPIPLTDRIVVSLDPANHLAGNPSCLSAYVMPLHPASSNPLPVLIPCFIENQVSVLRFIMASDALVPETSVLAVASHVGSSPVSWQDGAY